MTPTQPDPPPPELGTEWQARHANHVRRVVANVEHDGRPFVVTVNVDDGAPPYGWQLESFWDQHEPPDAAHQVALALVELHDAFRSAIAASQARAGHGGWEDAWCALLSNISPTAQSVLLGRPR